MLWDDLFIGGATDSAVYWEVCGSGADERLIVQWQNVEFYDAWDPGSLTFQAVLRADGHITLNYRNITCEDLDEWNYEGLSDLWKYTPEEKTSHSLTITTVRPRPSFATAPQLGRL